MKMYSIGFLSTNIPYRLAQKGCKKHILCSQSIFGLLFSKQSFGCAHPIRSLHFWLKIYSLGASSAFQASTLRAGSVSFPAMCPGHLGWCLVYGRLSIHIYCLTEELPPSSQLVKGSEKGKRSHAGTVDRKVGTCLPASPARWNQPYGWMEPHTPLHQVRKPRECSRQSLKSFLTTHFCH